MFGALGLAVAAVASTRGLASTPAPLTGSEGTGTQQLTSASVREAPTPPGSEAPASAPCSSRSLVVVAHTDDDLLFINPDQQRAITAGTCLHTVFVTAGDAGQDANYWTSRERGARAAYAFMAGVADDWEQRTISSRGLHLLTLKADQRISLVFMRLPDGMQRGTGAKRNQGQSLKKLWRGDIASMTAVDGTNTYSKTQLVETLTELMFLTRPGTVRTLDYVNGFNDTDHSDHHAVGYLTRQASRQYSTQYGARHALVAYQGYTIASKKANLSAADTRVKLAAFDTYAQYDYVGQNRKYIPRRYVLSKSS